MTLMSKTTLLNGNCQAKQMVNILGYYLRSVDAQRPTFKKSGKLVLWPDEMFYR